MYPMKFNHFLNHLVRHKYSNTEHKPSVWPICQHKTTGTSRRTCSGLWLVPPVQTAPWSYAPGRWSRWNPHPTWAPPALASPWTGTAEWCATGHPEYKQQQNKISYWHCWLSMLFRWMSIICVKVWNLKMDAQHSTASSFFLHSFCCSRANNHEGWLPSPHFLFFQYLTSDLFWSKQLDSLHSMGEITQEVQTYSLAKA